MEFESLNTNKKWKGKGRATSDNEPNGPNGPNGEAHVSPSVQGPPISSTMSSHNPPHTSTHRNGDVPGPSVDPSSDPSSGPMNGTMHGTDPMSHPGLENFHPTDASAPCNMDSRHEPAERMPHHRPLPPHHQSQYHTQITFGPSHNHSPANGRRGGNGRHGANGRHNGNGNHNSNGNGNGNGNGNRYRRHGYHNGHARVNSNGRGGHPGHSGGHSNGNGNIDQNGKSNGNGYDNINNSDKHVGPSRGSHYSPYEAAPFVSNAMSRSASDGPAYFNRYDNWSSPDPGPFSNPVPGSVPSGHVHRPLPSITSITRPPRFSYDMHQGNPYRPLQGPPSRPDPSGPHWPSCTADHWSLPNDAHFGHSPYQVSLQGQSLQQTPQLQEHNQPSPQVLVRRRTGNPTGIQTADPKETEDDGDDPLPADAVISTEKDLRDFLSELKAWKTPWDFAFSINMQGVRLGESDGEICILAIKADPKEHMFRAGGHNALPRGDPLHIMNKYTTLGNSNINRPIRPYTTPELAHACQERVIDVKKLKVRAFDVHAPGRPGFSLRSILEDARQLKLMWSPHIAGVNLKAEYNIFYDRHHYSPYENGPTCGLIDLQLMESAVRQVLLTESTELDFATVKGRSANDEYYKLASLANAIAAYLANQPGNSLAKANGNRRDGQNGNARTDFNICERASNLFKEHKKLVRDRLGKALNGSNDFSQLPTDPNAEQNGGNGVRIARYCLSEVRYLAHLYCVFYNVLQALKPPQPQQNNQDNQYSRCNQYSRYNPYSRFARHPGLALLIRIHDKTREQAAMGTVPTQVEDKIMSPWKKRWELDEIVHRETLEPEHFEPPELFSPLLRVMQQKMQQRDKEYWAHGSEPGRYARHALWLDTTTGTVMQRAKSAPTATAGPSRSNQHQHGTESGVIQLTRESPTLMAPVTAEPAATALSVTDTVPTAESTADTAEEPQVTPPSIEAASLVTYTPQVSPTNPTPANSTPPRSHTRPPNLSYNHVVDGSSSSVPVGNTLVPPAPEDETLCRDGLFDDCSSSSANEQ